MAATKCVDLGLSDKVKILKELEGPGATQVSLYYCRIPDKGVCQKG